MVASMPDSQPEAGPHRSGWSQTPVPSLLQVPEPLSPSGQERPRSRAPGCRQPRAAGRGQVSSPGTPFPRLEPREEAAGGRKPPRGPCCDFARRSAATQQEIACGPEPERCAEPCRGCSRPSVPAGGLTGSPHHRHPPWKRDGSRGAAAGPRVEDAGPKPPAEHGAEQ